ncbi:MAG: tetratricopeptide repeat protein [Acidobacteria bacterium]|nr:tetratricopeptide repeat protein [Acidobacteriota bacterium]
MDWLTPRELFGIGKGSSVYNEGNRVGVFYAQSWAVVHFLYTQPGYRERIAEFAELLDEGVPAEEACLRAFRRSAKDVLEEARQRLLRGQFPVAELEGEALEAPLVQISSVGEEVVAELALARGRIALARRLYQRQGSATALGLLALAQGDAGAAGRYFDQAVAEGASESTPYFEAAMLRRDAKQPFEPLLRQAVQRNPRHAEAWFLLGLEAAKREQWEDAVEAYQKATAILPRQANFWHGMALALRRAGRAAEASRAALQCRMAASNAPEREMAAALIALVSTPPARSAVRGPAVIIPDSWEGLQGDAVSDGVLEELVCGDSTVMKVAAVGELRVLRPKEIRITGGATELACGPQRRKVRVGYIQATREVVSVEFLP